MKVGKPHCKNLLCHSSCANMRRNINLCVDGRGRGQGAAVKTLGREGIDPLQREGESFKIKLPHLHLLMSMLHEKEKKPSY